MDEELRVLAEFTVPGRPRTKGSLKVITPRGQKPRLVEDHAHSAPWRKEIVRAIWNQVDRAWDAQPYEGAVFLTVTFLFERKGATALGMAFPMVNAGVNANGDVDKLLRNLQDAMEDAKLIKNDCQVCGVRMIKRWAEPAEAPGILCTVQT